MKPANASESFRTRTGLGPQGSGTPGVVVSRGCCRRDCDLVAIGETGHGTESSFRYRFDQSGPRPDHPLKSNPGHFSLAARSQDARFRYCTASSPGAHMQRRAFIRFLGGAAASPLVVRAQQPAKMKRIAVVHPTESVANLAASDDPVSRAFFEELSHAGWREGKNLVVERYSAAGQPDRFAPLAREVVDTHPDAIYAISSFLALAFKAATTTIPIVTLTSDPVAAGLVSNIARPGGNVTGGSVDTGFEIWGKRIGLLKEALPKLSNIFLIAEKTARW